MLSLDQCLHESAILLEDVDVTASVPVRHGIRDINHGIDVLDAKYREVRWNRRISKRLHPVEVGVEHVYVIVGVVRHVEEIPRSIAGDGQTCVTRFAGRVVHFEGRQVLVQARPGADRAPGKEKLAKDRAIGNPNWRTRIKTNAAESTERIETAVGPHAYEASFRAGGGISIAALALASMMPMDGDHPRSEYLKVAEEAFQFLDKHNVELLNDGIENILDDYCALMAATELYSATHKDTYRAAADRRANQLMERLTQSGSWKNYWRADGGTRPFFHPSDAGLPVISLLEYARIATADQRSKVRKTVEGSLRFELSVTNEVNNPFGYARQLVRMGGGKARTAFFFPHDTEAAPWWQGENARLASLAAAARMALPLFADSPEFQSQLRAYAWNQLHWILGRNPFDTSMLIGSGHGNGGYMFFRSYKYTNAPGAIVNGITAGLQSEDGIAFNQGFAVTGQDEDWRWTEEWLPHAAWYLYAVSLPH